LEVVIQVQLLFGVEDEFAAYFQVGLGEQYIVPFLLLVLCLLSVTQSMFVQHTL
jgi:hypothetical protein